MGYTARDIDGHMRQVGTWVDFSATCDTFKSGDPNTPIQAIAVSWMSTTAALRKAHELGCNVFVTHEPTFYAHMDDDQSVDDYPCTKEKRAFLRETGMVVYRCHDVWDRVKDEGILDSWAAWLGLTGQTSGNEKHMRVVQIEPVLAGDFARTVADRIKPLGQEAVLLAGDPAKVVSRVGIGTGAIASVEVYYRLGADVGIITEVRWWRDPRWAGDMGMPVLVVDHTVSEEPGVMNLTAYLRRIFPGVRVEYLPTHCPYRLVPSGG